MQGLETKTLACVIAATGFAAGLGAAYLAKPGKENGTASAIPAEQAGSGDRDEPLRSTLGGPGAPSSPPPRGRSGLIAAGNSGDGTLTGRIRNYVRVIMAAEKEDFPGIMRDAMQELGDDGPFSEMVLPIIAQQWVKADPVGAFEEVFTGELSTLATRHFSYEVVEPMLKMSLETDPEHARAIVLKNQHLAFGRKALETIVLHEAEAGSQAALQTLAQVKDPKDAADITEELFEYWAKGKDPVRALHLLRDVPNYQPQDGMLEYAFRTMAKNDVQKALELANGLDSEHLRANALYGVAEQWADLDRDAAFAHIESIESPRDRSVMLRKLQGVTAKTDPELAANGTLEIPSRMVRNSAIQDVSRQWFSKDPEAASQWMDANLDPETWERAAESVVLNSLNRSQFNQVSEMAKRLPADNRAVKKLVQRWSRLDSDALEAWITTQNPGRQQALRSHAGGHRHGTDDAIIHEAPRMPQDSAAVPADAVQVMEVLDIDPVTGLEVRRQVIVTESELSE